MATVALDTSALMMPVELDVRLFDELDRLLAGVEPVVPRAVVEELRRLADAGGGTEATAAGVGLDLVSERCRIIDADGHADADGADDVLVALAASDSVDYVATNDRSLRDRLLDAGTPVLGVRGRNTLAITEP